MIGPSLGEQEIVRRQRGDARHCHAVVGVQVDDAAPGKTGRVNHQVQEGLGKIGSWLACVRGNMGRCLRRESIREEG